MSHQVNRCGCGRTRHWPHNAKVGDTWRCRRCGQVTTLVPSGTPGAKPGIIIPSVVPRGKTSLRSRPHLPIAKRPAPRPPPSLLQQIINLLVGR